MIAYFLLAIYFLFTGNTRNCITRLLQSYLVCTERLVSKWTFPYDARSRNEAIQW